jgi:RNA polymerase sigma-70 factor (ECF subfamily)
MTRPAYACTERGRFLVSSPLRSRVSGKLSYFPLWLIGGIERRKVQRGIILGVNPAPSVEITGLLKAWAGGDRGALERLTPLVYAELRRMAGRYMAKERPGNSLQATALVNEAFLRLVEVDNVRWQDRAHFFGVSAQMMRRILVDAARARGSEKRGGAIVKVDLNQSIDAMPDRGSQLVALDEALDALAQLDPRKAKVVEMRFFGGLSVEETAEVLKISAQSVMRDWKLARAWLMREMGK